MTGDGATSEAEIGGGGGRPLVVGMESRDDFFELYCGRDRDGEAGALARGVGVSDVSDDESSFSQAMSGDQIRSGSERTTMGGARSASRCLSTVSHDAISQRVRYQTHLATLTRWMAIVPNRKNDGIRRANESRLLRALIISP